MAGISHPPKQARQRASEQKAQRRAYRQRPEVKAKGRAEAIAYRQKHREQIAAREQAKYRNNPDVRARKLARARAQWLAVKDDPEHRAKRKAHLQRPDVMSRRRELQRGYHKTPKWKAWKRAYAQRPDVKERQRIYRQRYRAKRRNRTGAPLILE
jgi:hypothetical protein